MVSFLKSFRKLHIRVKFLNFIRLFAKKLQHIFYLMEKPLIHCRSGSGMRKGMLLSPLLCNTVLEALAKATEKFQK